MFVLERVPTRGSMLDTTNTYEQHRCIEYHQHQYKQMSRTHPCNENHFDTSDPSAMRNMLCNAKHSHSRRKRLQMKYALWGIERSRGVYVLVW